LIKLIDSLSYVLKAFNTPDFVVLLRADANWPPIQGLAAKYGSGGLSLGRLR
jgi:hypothetical protein